MGGITAMGARLDHSRVYVTSLADFGLEGRVHNVTQFRAATESMLSFLGLQCPPTWATRKLPLAKAIDVAVEAAGLQEMAALDDPLHPIRCRTKECARSARHGTDMAISSAVRIHVQQSLLEDPSLGPLLRSINRMTGCNEHTRLCHSRLNWVLGWRLNPGWPRIEIKDWWKTWVHGGADSLPLKGAQSMHHLSA